MKKHRVIQKVEFVGSFPEAPVQTDLPEIAFVGRSNVGKSSAINTLLNRKKAARVGRTPGRTQAINVFELDQELRFIDLPGYGFAKVPEYVRAQWGKMIENFLFDRPILKLVVVLVDGRHSAQPLDLQMMKALKQGGIPFLIVATKIDRIKRSKRKHTLNVLKKGLAVQAPNFIPFSSETKEGLGIVWKKIEEACK